jgi:hypothetical protein
VYRIDQQRARLRPVQVGVLTDRDAEVLSGLNPGDSVIIYPSDLVHDGLRVQPRAAGRILSLSEISSGRIDGHPARRAFGMQPVRSRPSPTSRITFGL